MYGNREDVTGYVSVAKAAKDLGVASTTIIRALYKQNQSGHQADMLTSSTGAVVRVTPISIPRTPPAFRFKKVYQGVVYTTYDVVRHNQSRTVSKKVITLKHKGVWYTVAGIPQALRLIIDTSDRLLDSLKAASTPTHHPFHDEVCRVNGFLRRYGGYIYEVDNSNLIFELRA